MRRIIAVPFMWTVFLVLLSGCGADTGPGSKPGIDLVVDLQPAADLGYDVSRVVIIVAGSFVYRRTDLLINGNTATGSMGNLKEGKYTVTVKVHAGPVVLASGFRSLSAGTETVAFTWVDWEALFPDLPRSILFIGNSLTLTNGGLAEHFQAMAADFDPHVTITCGMVARGGMTLMNHWTINNSGAVAAVESGEYDLVVLQPSPGSVIDGSSDYATAIKNFTTLARDNGSEAVLLVPHTYTDAPDQAGTIVQRLHTVAKEAGIDELPMNQTWEAWQEERPEVSLYTDSIHQTPLGTYLYLCVAYAGILETSPVGLTFVNDEGISATDRDQMQSLAWDTVSSYRGWTPQ